MWKVGEKNKAKLESILIETFWFFNPLKLMPEDNSNNSKCHQLGDNKCFSHCCVAVLIAHSHVTCPHPQLSYRIKISLCQKVSSQVGAQNMHYFKVIKNATK